MFQEIDEDNEPIPLKTRLEKLEEIGFIPGLL